MPGTFCGWIFILVLIYIYTGFTLILRTTSLFFPDGQAGGQVAARSLRWSFLAKSEGGKGAHDLRPLTYLQFSVIKWAKQRPGQNPIDVKSDEAIQI